MPPEILNYLKTQKIGVLAVELLDGSPHGATVHFANNESPFVFYFETNREYRKNEAILKNGSTRASFVVGTTEDIMITFQLDGAIELVSDAEKELFLSIYLKKFPEKTEKITDPKFIFLKFTPTWWKFTDWTNKESKKVLSSED